MQYESILVGVTLCTKEKFGSTYIFWGRCLLPIKGRAYHSLLRASQLIALDNNNFISFMPNK